MIYSRIIHSRISVPALLMVMLIAAAPLLAVNDSINQSAPDQAAAREKAFSDQMAGCVLIGSFTVDGKSDGDPLKEERYEIESAVRASENLWVFTTRIKYGKIDTKLPITVPLQWAGDTPMVTLTNATLPGLGDEFSARVLFYENRYAGTWQHGKIGGHMFGRIEKTPAVKTPAVKTP